MLAVIGLALLALTPFCGGQGIYHTPHPCERECDGRPMECHYELVVEWFMTLSKACFNCPFNREDCYRPHCIPSNGNRRLAAVINRQMPGPTINVCEGDTIHANVTNDMENGVTLAIHWHGFHQRGTPYMDGVPYVTQCPFIYRNSFLYKFNAKEVGTFFYHSHEGLSLGDGVFGALIVRRKPSENAHYKLYDHSCADPANGIDIPDCEHVIILQDWAGNSDWLDYMRDKFYTNKRGWPGADERVMMINGQNRMYPIFTIDSVENDGGSTAYTPYHYLTVKKGKKYRFRVVGSTTNACRFLIDISGHRLKVISTDGADVKPLDVDVVTLFGGERYDFVVDANKPVANYWIRLRNIGPCHHNAYAILHYEGAPDPWDASIIYDDTQFDGPVHEDTEYLNPPLSSDSDRSPTWNNWPYEKNVYTVADLEGLDPLPHDMRGKADKVFYLAFDVEYHGDHYNHHEYYPGYSLPDPLHPGQAIFNNISMQLPVAPPLSQPEMDKYNHYCNSDDADHEDCLDHMCHCTHMLEVDLGDVVDLVQINEAWNSGWTGHPNHIHGTYGAVIAYDKLGDHLTKAQIRELYESGNMKLDFDNPVLKDNIQIPGGGYTVQRFKADNPGVWIMHCHILFHAMEGMDLVIKVGKHSDFPPLPKGFPKCGPFDHDDELGDYSGPEKDPECPKCPKCPKDSGASTPAISKLSCIFITMVTVLSCLLY